MHALNYYPSSGLEVVRLNEQQLSLALYGRRFTVNDTHGLVYLLLETARSGLNKTSFCQRYQERFPLPVIEASISSLIDTHILVQKNNAGIDASTADLIRHASAMNGGFSLQATACEPTWQILLIGEGQIAEALGTALRSLGLAVRRCALIADLHPDDTRQTFVVACADDENHEYFRRINDQLVRHGLPCLYIALDFQIVRCGPLVVPKSNACYECYFHRLSSTRRHQNEFVARNNPDNILHRPIPSVLSNLWAAAISATQILSFVSGVCTDLQHSPIREIDTLKGENNKSNLLKLPRCPVCGNGNANRPLTPVTHTRSSQQKV